MKLLFCPECYDMLALTPELRTCACGKSRGAYDKDGYHATVYGSALVIGMLNSTLNGACLSHGLIPEDQMTIACFLFPEPHRNITYERSADALAHTQDRRQVRSP